MILYVDTSALVPLLIEEPSSARCGELWDSADRLTTTRLTYVEAVAAVAQGTRLGRISMDEAADAREVLDELWIRQSTLSLTPEHRLHAGCPSMRPGSTPSWPRTLLLLFAHVR